ncbi:MAG: hypothetical protein HYV63_00765 [Candidatus Schekmanbacteria bacterium]|nr:hypothetical protein [Candidatus Schekmanbacteria bacterium]
MLAIENSFVVRATLDRAWDLFTRFEDLAMLIPTVQELKAEPDGESFHGRVGVTLGKLPVTSRLSLRIIETKPYACLKAEGVSYLGETVQDQLKKGTAGAIDRSSMGRFRLHLDLRPGETCEEVLIKYEAEVEADGRLRRIYQSIIKNKAPAMMEQFAENIRRNLEAPLAAPGEASQEVAVAAVDTAAVPARRRPFGANAAAALARLVMGVWRWLCLRLLPSKGIAA